MDDQALLLRLALDWITQYARFQALDPALLEELRRREGEFQAVALPRQLTRLLELAETPPPETVRKAIEAAMASIATELPAMRFVDDEPGGAGPEVAAALRSLGRALEDGDREAALAWIARDYRDAAGRGRDELAARIDELFAGTSKRRFVLIETEVMSAAGAEPVVVMAAVAWESEPPRAAVTLGGERFDVVVNLVHEDGPWRIQSLSPA